MTAWHVLDTETRERERKKVGLVRAIGSEIQLHAHSIKAENC